VRATAICPVCFYETHGLAGSRPKEVLGELDNNGHIHVRCEKGHYGIAVYDARRYQVLIQSAAKAYVDGYTNEVIAVMGTALERAYEFYVRVSCRAKGITLENVEAAWKGVAMQSERQFGAFQFLHLVDHGEPFVIDDSIAKTRNRVVHRGQIATEREAVECAEKVFSRIRAIESEIQARFATDAAAEVADEVKAQLDLVPEGTQALTVSTHAVEVDESKHEVIAAIRSFMDLAIAEIQDRERGAPY